MLPLLRYLPNTLRHQGPCTPSCDPDAPDQGSLPYRAPPRPSEAIIVARALATTCHNRAAYRSHEADEGRNDSAGKA
jgi:hypothetical protein